MPFVNVKLIKGVFDPDQKQEMIHKLTETMVGIEGEAMRQVTWVTIEEVESGDWGIGGNALTTQDVKDLQARTWSHSIASRSRSPRGSSSCWSGRRVRQIDRAPAHRRPRGGHLGLAAHRRRRRHRRRATGP
jgi:4-oxalocrotonate tautomerase